ncbi:PilZ domain-containing protein [Roseomonas eburnea]|uniref:PilZ domain-containing protein n=1 Tax=Neoroseomonas eburnea TaxID=1346889 RepID=A0A9X9XFP4_9PROT|nr:PilZ domain-containing protein [Neoroseomonas eburnea]MBR0682530.1 PilZ domain-containing protein [Neoroseomonas eburnea]
MSANDTPASADFETIAAALDERRDGPRFPLREDCLVAIGPHVQEAFVRDVSAGGAMLHGVRGVIAGDLVRIRLQRLPERPILARIRGISLIGVHLSIEGDQERAVWREALKDVLG